jgi:hypothetical protein
MKKSQLAQLLLAVILLAGAGFGFYRFLRDDSGISEQTFFYDLSAKKLFAAPREALPPIRGIDNPEEDAVRAIVICVSGDPAKAANRSIAYLEKYTPELKQSLELVRAGKAEPLPRGQRKGYVFVKRAADNDWVRSDTPEGEQIMNGWNVPGPDGKMPVVCVP